MTGVLIATSAGAVIVLIALFILFKRKKPASGGEKIFEQVETSAGCPEEVKRAILKERQKLFEEAQRVYGEIQNLLKDRKLPPQLEEEYRNFLRIYNIIEEMEKEIELYPASNCGEYFREKINFYRKLIGEFHSKVRRNLQT